MKKASLIFLSFIGFVIIANSQELPIDEESGRVSYEAILDMEGTKSELYYRSVDWFSVFYKNPKGVIKEKDLGKGKITAKHKFMLQIKDDKGVNKDVGFIIYSLKIWTKDDKYRYKITDIHLQYTVYYGIEEWMKPDHEDAANNNKKLSNIDSYIQEIIASLAIEMQPKKPKKDEDDW